MFSSTNLVCLFFLLTTSLSSLQTHARDSQFFSKVSRTHDDETTAIPDNNYYKSHDDQVTPLVKPQEQQKEAQPAFVPQTTHTGYGLYGHETGLDAPSTTTSPSMLYDMDDTKYENQNNFNDNEMFVNSREEKNYVPELTGLSETSHTNNVVRPTKFVAQNNYNNKINRNNNFKDNNYELENKQNEKNYAPELTGLGETSYTNNVAQNNYNNINHKYNHKNEYIGNDQEEKSYTPELTGLSETSYTNNVGPNNYNYNTENEYIGNDREEKSYVPELAGLDETSSYTSNNVGPNKYVAQNNYNYNYNNNNHKYNMMNNERIENDQAQKTYAPELTSLGQTSSYTNNVGPNKYLPRNNYNNNNNHRHHQYNNEYTRNEQEEKSYVPELTGLGETSSSYATNNVGPNKYVHQNKYNYNYNNNENDEKHGMRDTRYMENGKYFYDMSFDSSYINNKYYNYKGNDVQKEYNNQFPKEVEDFEFDDQP